MDRLATLIAKLIAFGFALILMVALPISVLVYNLGRVIFNGPLVTRVVTEIVTESDLIPAGLEWFSEQRADERYRSGEAEAWVGEPDMMQLVEFLDLNDWRTIRREVLPDEILAEFVSVSVEGTYVWIDSDDRVPDITWNLQPFINRVNSEHGIKSITIAYDALPECKEDQIADFKSRLAADPPGAEVLYNLCEFPDPWHPDQFNDYVESLNEMVSEIPGQFALTGELAGIDDTQGAGPEFIKTQLRLIRRLKNLAPLISLALLVLILIFGVRSLKGLGLWWGIPLALSSLITLIIAFVHSVIIRVLSAGPLSEVPPLIGDEAISAVLRLAREVFRPMLWQSLIILAIGLALVIIGIIAKSKPVEPRV